MAEKPKVRGAKRKAAKRMTKTEQSRAFIKTAREHGVDESGEEFERLFTEVISRTGRNMKTG